VAVILVLTHLERSGWRVALCGLSDGDRNLRAVGQAARGHATSSRARTAVTITSRCRIQPPSETTAGDRDVGHVVLVLVPHVLLVLHCSSSSRNNSSWWPRAPPRVGQLLDLEVVLSSIRSSSLRSTDISHPLCERGAALRRAVFAAMCCWCCSCSSSAGTTRTASGCQARHSGRSAPRSQK